MTSALVVIDFQNAIFTDPSAYQGLLVQDRIRGLISMARAAGVAVVYVQHDEAGTIWEKGTETWRFPDAIAPQPGDYVSTKTICDAFQGTALQDHLVAQGITRVFICGYATEFCIDTNVRRAASGNLLETIVVSDAHTTRDRPHLDAAKIIEHHNWVWSGFGGITLTPSDAVEFAGEATAR